MKTRVKWWCVWFELSKGVRFKLDVFGREDLVALSLKKSVRNEICHYTTATHLTLETFVVCCMCPSPGPAVSNTKSAGQHCLFSGRFDDLDAKIDTIHLSRKWLKAEYFL